MFEGIFRRAVEKPAKVETLEDIGLRDKFILMVDTVMNGNSFEDATNLPERVTADDRRRTRVKMAMAGGVFGNDKIQEIIRHIPRQIGVTTGEEANTDEEDEAFFEKIYKSAIASPDVSDFINFININTQKRYLEKLTETEAKLASDRRAAFTPSDKTGISLEPQGGHQVLGREDLERLDKNLIPTEPDIDIFLSRNSTPYQLLRTGEIEKFVKDRPDPARAKNEIHAWLKEAYGSKYDYCMAINDIKVEIDRDYAVLMVYRKNVLPTLLREIQKAKKDGLDPYKEKIELARHTTYNYAIQEYYEQCKKLNKKPWERSFTGTVTITDRDLLTSILGGLPLSVFDSYFSDLSERLQIAGKKGISISDLQNMDSSYEAEALEKFKNRIQLV